MKPYHRPSILKDVCSLAPNLRPEDKREVEALGSNPERSLVLGYIYSTICRSIIDSKGVVVGMYGVCPTEEPKVGRVWMLGSKGLLKISREFLRHSRTEVDKMNTKYNLLCNYIDSRNKAHIRWIRWCGFKIIGETMFNNIKFYEFSRIT